MWSREMLNRWPLWGGVDGGIGEGLVYSCAAKIREIKGRSPMSDGEPENVVAFASNAPGPVSTCKILICSRTLQGATVMFRAGTFTSMISSARDAMV